MATTALAAFAPALPGMAQPLGPGLETPAAKAGPNGVFLVEPVAEKTIDRLPVGPLYWRVESFPSLAEAQRAAGLLSLAAEAWGQAWLFTLGSPGGSSAGGQKAAEVGPVPIPVASRYLLRINRAGGPPGSRTPVHTHAGSEAFYVLKGQVTQKGPHGATRLDAGRAMNGHEPGMVMQLASTGAVNLEQLVMFVVDAEKPFSSPARFD
jgi:hypothetical protein